MDREVLFRGKRLNNGEWVESGSVMNLCPGVVKLDTVFEWAMVDPATVGQYTGMTDKNGVKIFEGDIVYDEIEHKNAVVTFERGAFWLDYHNHADLNDNEWADIVGQLTVIGNIHDNPELLEA